MTHPNEVLTSATAFDATLGVFIPEGTPVSLHPTQPLTELFEEEEALRAMTFETRLEAAERESKARSAKIEVNMVEADAKGELWTVQAALYPGRVFCLVYLGRHDDTGPLESQHGTAGAIFGPLHLIGKSHREALAQALSLFSVDEITIRTIR